MHVIWGPTSRYHGSYDFVGALKHVKPPIQITQLLRARTFGIPAKPKMSGDGMRMYSQVSPN